MFISKINSLTFTQNNSNIIKSKPFESQNRECISVKNLPNGLDKMKRNNHICARNPEKNYSLKINLIRNNMNIIHFGKNSSRINFCGNIQDNFTPSPRLKMYNPYGDCYGSIVIPSDLTKPAKLELLSTSRMSLEYDPECFDYLIDKQTGEKLKTMILKSKNNNGKISYHFLSEKLDKEYGYVTFLHCENPKASFYSFSELLEDKPQEGIVGKRLIIDYLQNFNDKKIGGVGKLADKLSVKHCLENDLPFNIVSVADRGSHAAHYIRGKRFFPIIKSEDPFRYQYLEETYGKTDINEILKILTAENKGGKIIPQIGFAAMYMPKELVTKYLNELKAHPFIK